MDSVYVKVAIITTYKCYGLEDSKYLFVLYTHRACADKDLAEGVTRDEDWIHRRNIHFPCSTNEYRHHVVESRAFPWRDKPMRQDRNGHWYPNRHQRKHGLLAMPQGKEVC